MDPPCRCRGHPSWGLIHAALIHPPFVQTLSGALAGLAVVQSYTSSVVFIGLDAADRGGDPRPLSPISAAASAAGCPPG